MHGDSIENKIALRSDDRKSNFSNNFTVLRFLVDRVVCKRIWRAEDIDDDKPTDPQIGDGFLSKSENRDYWFISFSRARFSYFYFLSQQSAYTHCKTKSEFPEAP